MTVVTPVIPPCSDYILPLCRQLHSRLPCLLLLTHLTVSGFTVLTYSASFPPSTSSVVQSAFVTRHPLSWCCTPATLSHGAAPQPPSLTLCHISTNVAMHVADVKRNHDLHFNTPMHDQACLCVLKRALLPTVEPVVTHGTCCGTCCGHPWKLEWSPTEPRVVTH